jgi:hypothetical protein
VISQHQHFRVTDQRIMGERVRLNACPQLLHSSPMVVVQIQNRFPKKLTRLSVAGVPHRGHLTSQSISKMISTVHAGMNGMMLS